MKIEIDVEQFAKDIKAGKSIGGADGALGSLIKQLTEAADIDTLHNYSQYGFRGQKMEIN